MASPIAIQLHADMVKACYEMESNHVKYGAHPTYIANISDIEHLKTNIDTSLKLITEHNFQQFAGFYEQHGRYMQMIKSLPDVFGTPVFVSTPTFVSTTPTFVPTTPKPTPTPTKAKVAIDPKVELKGWGEERLGRLSAYELRQMCDRYGVCNPYNASKSYCVSRLMALK
ncbi:hypothetical protein EhV290 [Emiliania huxleyi virus 86]|uniref:Uncharacterized protein n=1 Tax=Emiliania huxleyi virus 86 (isolate United Kingdom/English Channel/1999) TaxID=654925 RepID=Q4A2J0_EHV8U|nr:hypothetical protein EhV290 [Emiliania huxleyi virus 86]AHA54898.1 hypothetical protein EhV145_00348 [Emiliania huxleyi virus 145]CAI65716.1 hypothetical protein EhV290 [Emiliania huxleyi virus 86]